MSWKFWKNKPAKTLTPEEEDLKYQAFYDEKTTLFESALGKEHDLVIHAIISYEAGGALHGYFYPNHIEGTGVVTKQLARWDGSGASNDSYNQYEMVMFTREDLTEEDLLESDEKTPAQRAYRQLRGLLNTIAPYSEQATLNPFETIGFPEEMEEVAGRFIILDKYKPENFEKNLGLMLLIEIFESEFVFKQENGGDALIQKLKDAGHYPYSDLNRSAVA